MPLDDNNEIIVTNHLRRLQKLIERKSLLGINTPPEVLIEIEDIKLALNNLQGILDSSKPFSGFEGSREKQTAISILFLAADPTDITRLRLSEEFREIKDEIKLSRLREYFKLELPQLALRPEDISRALLDTLPQIVHFSGHGSSNGALCFENRSGRSFLAEPEALAVLFEQFREIVKCIVLSACYSEVQAKALSKHIDFVIGMNRSISDKAAIAFAIGFYQGIGGGSSIETAFKLGCVQIMLKSTQEYQTPVLLKKQSQKPNNFKPTPF